MIRSCFCVLAISILTLSTDAQEKPYRPSPVDGDYITEHNNELAVRIYGSNKFTRLSYGEYRVKDKALYKPNDNYNLGVGFSYQWLNLNLGFKAPFINEDNEKRGRTKFIDLQAYGYARKFVVDLYAQSYEGYYFPVKRNDLLAIPFTENLVRNDIQTRNLGFNVEYIFNNRKFSYRAAFLQNETQKKSAGSFILGGGIHYLNVRADSSILPQDIRYPDYLANPSFNRSSVGSITINGGYAYHLVLGKRFFAMASLMLGAGVNSMTLQDTKSDENMQAWSPTFNGIVHAGMGYNSDRSFVGIYFTTNLRQDEMPISNAFQRYETGVVKVAVARRFAMKPSVASRLRNTGLFQ